MLVWHVHGSYATALLQGPHTYYLPVEPNRGPAGRGRARTWDWPPAAVEIDAATSRRTPYDVVVFQRAEELGAWHDEWLGDRVAGRDYAAVYLEHDAPWSEVPLTPHAVADRDDLTLVHVTHFNALFYDAGSTRTRVIEHGVADPGERYTGELPHAAVAINEARRRGRYSGTDLLARFAEVAPVDLFGMDAASLGGYEDLPQERLHAEMARRRAYVHPFRWTSLGLALIEAMMLGMPVVALATTEVPEAVPSGCGFVSTNVDRLAEGFATLVRDAELARAMGARARTAALARYGLGRFLHDWNDVFEEVTR